MHTTILRKFISYLSILSFLSYLSFCIPAKAEEPVLPTVDSVGATALTITPSISENVLVKRKTTSQVFELKNNSSIPLPIKCYIRNFDASDEAGGVVIPDEADTKRLSPRNWIEIADPDCVVQPGRSHEIKLNFNPPVDLPPGGYYAILFAEPLIPESFLSQSSLQIGGRLGSLLFLIGPGDMVEKGEIASFDLKKYIWSADQLESKVRFSNTGNVHLRPSGKIIITNLITRSQNEIKVPEFTVLPGKIRQQIINMGEIKWPGAYKIQLQIHYGRDKITTEETKLFYYLPLVYLLVTIGFVGSFLVLLIGKTRKRVVKALKVIIKGEK